MIPSIYQTLTKSEKEVADVVKKDLVESVYWSTSGLAEFADVVLFTSTKEKPLHGRAFFHR